MTKIQALEVFEENNIRTVWDSDSETMYFCIVDVVAALTGSTNPTDYIKKMKHRDSELAKGWGQFVTPLYVDTRGGRQRINCADMTGLFRIIQSIPSHKAEPIKLWIAQVASQRIDQMFDPELSIEQAMADYKRQGYSDAWIRERLRSIEVRHNLTDEWKRSGIDDSKFYAILTNVMTRQWSGKTVREYKEFKGLTKQSLRDNMTNIELALNTLAEASTTELSRQENPKGFKAASGTAKRGGDIARTAREALENELGRSVISPAKASDYLITAAEVEDDANGKKE